jgi:hypothetical protein
VRPQPVGQDLAAHAVAAWTARVRAALPERRLPVVTLQSLCPHGLTNHRACGCLARGKRIAPRSRSLGLHPSGPVQGQWDCLAVWARAHTSKRLLTTPHRAGLQGLAALPRPAAGSCGAIGDQGCSRSLGGCGLLPGQPSGLPGEVQTLSGHTRWMYAGAPGWRWTASSHASSSARGAAAPVSVRRLARVCHAACRPHLTLMPVRFARLHLHQVGRGTCPAEGRHRPGTRQ